ncbi:MAG: alanine dehydrogenase [Pseudomonadota bacterium]|jgi:alanine dehydrogenase
MIIGVPAETKVHEYRTALTPDGARTLRADGHEVRVQHGAGRRAGHADAAYAAAGAVLVDAPEAWAADIVVKVKEPQPPEYAHLRAGQVLYGYLHLAAAPDLAAELVARGVTGIAYETVTGPRGDTPLLAPMSRIAGRLAIQSGMHALEAPQGGSGVLLPGAPGVEPGHVLVIGGGMVGSNAARIALGIGARVTLLDVSPERLAQLDEQWGGRVQTRLSDEAGLAECVARADLVVGAVYVQGRRAPVLLHRDHLRAMRPGSVLVDVAIDQGGIAETSRPTTHAAPTYVEEGVVHHCVANMPSAVALTSTAALAAVTLPGLRSLARQGVRAALESDAGLASGLNVASGEIVHPGLARDLGRAARDWRTLAF